MKDDIKLIPLRENLKGNMNFVSYVNQDIGIIHFTHKYMNQFNEFYWEKYRNIMRIIFLVQMIQISIYCIC